MNTRLTGFYDRTGTASTRWGRLGVIGFSFFMVKGLIWLGGALLLYLAR